MSGMRALILGGTSYFGKDIAKDFHEAGYEVTLFTRGEKKPEDLPPHKHIKGSRQSAEDLKKAAGPWDVVIDNIGYTGADMELLLRSVQMKRFLFTSTISVYKYGDGSWPLKEDSIRYDAKPADEDLSNVHWKYARGKLDAERVVSDADVPWTILRPTLVLGPHDVTQRSFWYVNRLLKGGPILLANGGEQSFRLAYSLDVAKAYLDVLDSDRTAGQAYFLAQQEVITLKSFLEETAKALKVELVTVNVPKEFLGDLGGPFAGMGNIIPAVNKAMREFGYRPTPFREMVSVTAKWFRDKWQGDETKLIASRDEELALAAKWKKASSIFEIKMPS